MRPQQFGQTQPFGYKPPQNHQPTDVTMRTALPAKPHQGFRINELNLNEYWDTYEIDPYAYNLQDSAFYENSFPESQKEQFDYSEETPISVDPTILENDKLVVTPFENVQQTASKIRTK